MESFKMTTTRRSMIVAIALVGMLVPASVKLTAQTARDTTAIELAAAAALREVVDRNSVFDDRATILKSDPGIRESSRTLSIASAMGLALGSKRSLVDCPIQRPESCRLLGDSSVYTLDHPVIKGDTAVIMMRHYFRLNIGRHKVGQEGRKVILARRGKTWVFVRWGTRYSS